MLFICENNLYAMGTAIERHQSQTDIGLKAAAYGMPAGAADGMDVLAVESVTRRAASRVRRGEGPFLLELRTYRFRAHSMADPELYRTRQEVQEWKARDPIASLVAKLELEAAGGLAGADLAAIEASVAAVVGDAVRFAEAAPWEPVEDLTRHVYAEGPT